jgi:hypothetical protein
MGHKYRFEINLFSDLVVRSMVYAFFLTLELEGFCQHMPFLLIWPVVCFGLRMPVELSLRTQVGAAKLEDACSLLFHVTELQMLRSQCRKQSITASYYLEAKSTTWICHLE